MSTTTTSHTVGGTAPPKAPQDAGGLMCQLYSITDRDETAAILGRLSDLYQRAALRIQDSNPTTAAVWHGQGAVFFLMADVTREHLARTATTPRRRHAS